MTGAPYRRVRRHRSPASTSFPDKLHRIHRELTIILAECRPACVAIESVFYSVNARSALKLGHARGVAMLAAVEAGLPVFEYSPAAIKRAVVGYGRADKPVQHMIKLLLRLAAVRRRTMPPTRWRWPSAMHAQPPSRAIGAVQPARAGRRLTLTDPPPRATLRRGKPAGS
jgi:hypothetical protein